MLSVDEARARILAALPPLGSETVGLEAALGRVLAEDVAARLTQPFADLSAMDGYAVRAADVGQVPVTLTVIGEAPAGGAYAGTVGAGQAVRIFTGGPLPKGADAVVIQEDTDRAGDKVTVKETAAAKLNVRPAGLDFRQGAVVLPQGRRLAARDISLAAAANRPWLQVGRRPRVAILATGDELVNPGDPIGPNQIVSSNGVGLSAFVRAHGGEPVNLGIAPDDAGSLKIMAQGAAGADLLVTIGGASVGDHDLIQKVLGEVGLTVDFWKIAMKPGKPLMFGSFNGTPMLGLPGNPVSALVCALLYLGPALAKLQGAGATAPRQIQARLGAAVPANNFREDFLRAELATNAAGETVATAFPTQDSSMLALLSRADGLIRRPPDAPAAQAGDWVPVIPLD
ncbi:MAG TPA: gephyrin-like molybdotransferase Glp [Alphaproteobacteria bacterium]|jgi:molybdopterin molybdotransferase